MEACTNGKCTTEVYLLTILGHLLAGGALSFYPFGLLVLSLWMFMEGGGYDMSVIHHFFCLCGESGPCFLKPVGVLNVAKH